MRAHILIAALLSFTLAGPSTLALFAAAPEVPAHRFHLVHPTIDTSVHACIIGGAQSTFQIGLR
jgi:hypothetical protein